MAAQNARLGRALQRLGQDLYSSNTHFVLELVQVGAAGRVLTAVVLTVSMPGFGLGSSACCTGSAGASSCPWQCLRCGVHLQICPW
jgi:hypothetical protein